MPRAYSVELRARVVAAYHAEEGSRAEIGRRFNVGEATVNRWSALARKRGSLEPTKRASRPSQLLSTEGLEFIRQTLEALPDSTILKLVAAYAEGFGVTMSRTTMSRAVNETLGFTRKKGGLRSPAALSQEVLAEREAFLMKQPELSDCQLVFLDESAISTTLHHAYGRAPAGERVTLYAPTYGARRTLVGAVAVDGRRALAVLDEGLRITGFQAYVRDLLAPMLRPVDVVVMDNLRIHKNPDAVAAIKATGASVVFQPRYSPEFNAIEHCWSWIKHHLRGLGCRAIDQLVSHAKQ